MNVFGQEMTHHSRYTWKRWGSLITILHAFFWFQLSQNYYLLVLAALDSGLQIRYLSGNPTTTKDFLL